MILKLYMIVHTGVIYLYLNVGTPLSALTPDPVSTTMFLAFARISRNARILIAQRNSETMILRAATVTVPYAPGSSHLLYKGFQMFTN